jgi:hypothetical protein
MSESCQWAQCQNDATHGVRLRFWAKGYPRDTHQPAVTAPVVVVCEVHREQALKSEWFGREQRVQLAAAMRGAGHAEPDFDTAEAFLEPLA